MEKAKHDLEEERLRLKRLEKENDEIQQSVRVSFLPDGSVNDID